jgi:hypothetical protein
MIDGLLDVPPALLLIWQEIADCESPADIRRRVKGMLRDLRDQSEGFARQQISRDSDSKGSLRFEVHLHGAMDLLSGHGCNDIRCRVSAANRIARSVGLIADRVWLTDFLSERFVDFGRPTNSKLDEVVADVLVLSQLRPLILAGVIRFRSPWISGCNSCIDHFDRHVEQAAEELAYVFKSEFRIEKRPDGGFCAHTGRCLEPNMVFNSVSKNLKPFPSTKTYARYWVRQELRSALWTAREASMTGGAVVSNSRVGLAGLLQQDGRLVDMNTLLLMDKERAFSVPWVSELNAAQIVQLRQEASSALPQFREALSRAMSVFDSAAIASTNSTNLIADLREQASEVRSELEAKRVHSARYWKTTYGILGLGLSAYGVATDQVIPGVGGLLPIIHLLINHKSGHESEVSKLTRKPGFVLVKAQDILAHSHEL